MKKITLFAAFALLGAATILPSCNKKKDYTCVCTIPITGGDAIVQDHIYPDVTESVAKETCEKESMALGSNGSCKLK